MGILVRPLLQFLLCLPEMMTAAQRPTQFREISTAVPSSGRVGLAWNLVKVAEGHLRCLLFGAPGLGDTSQALCGVVP